MLSSSSSSGGDSATALSATYLVPSLLPICADTGLSNRNQWSNNTFFFFFVISGTFVNSKVMSWGEMEMSGFLPSSLFQRLICKAVNWSQLTTVEKSSSSEFSLLEVYKDVAVLRYGSQKFQLTNLVDKNCIRVDVEGLDPNPIYQRLREQLEVLIEECMHSLRFVTTLLISTALDEVKLNPVVPSSPAPSNKSPRAGTNASPGPTNNSSSSDNSNSNSSSSSSIRSSSSISSRSVSIEEILILRVERGSDHFITIKAVIDL